MAVDIAGWVEIRRSPPEHPFWKALIKIDSLLLRKYAMFASLFGVRNGGQFQPIAAERGLPTGASRQIRTQIQEIEQEGESAYHLTWIGWDEIKAIDWEEEAALYAIQEYQKDQGGRFQHRNAFYEHPRITPEIRQVLMEEGSWSDGQTLFTLDRSTREKRRDGLIEEWTVLFTLMEALAAHYGDSYVRLVVWFDQPQ